MLTEGFLVISDITGFSAYLNKSELDHAQDILTKLINLLIEYTRTPLVISKLEGDAVFSYAPKGSFRQGQTLMEMIESTYLAFRKAIEMMIINTSCRCNACKNIPKLDLKFLVHYGSYSMQKFRDNTELVGNEVNVVHRIAKNHIVESTGQKAYAAYTQKVLDNIKPITLADGMIQYDEDFPDVGNVHMWIQDMSEIWESRKDEVRIAVAPDEAFFSWDFNFDIPQPLLWDYITNPEYRNYFFDTDYQKTRRLTNGRINRGTVYVCAHGNSESLHTILDWQPFRQYTTREETGPPFHLVFTATYRLSAEEGGTRLAYNISRPEGTRLRVTILKPVLSLLIKTGILEKQMKVKLNYLAETIANEIAEGKTVLTTKIEFGNELAKKAAEKSLVENTAPDG